jgi:hypothetical protein
MTDLASGRYGAYDPVWLMLGKPNNATQSNVPVRSNASVIGLSTLVDNATQATKKGTLVAVPVQEGDVITKVTHLVGATAGKTGPFSFVALYSGTTEKTEAKLLGQSANKSTEIKASEPWTQELEKAVLITSTNAPNGYIFAGLVLEATTIETLVGVKIPTACQKVWFPGCPEVLAVATTQKAKSEAALTTPTETALELVPLVFLS